MTTLSTHDTKRGEDVRARLAVLAEMPGPTGPRALRRWVRAAPLPDPAFAHLLWQTVVGAWPIERERLHAYVEKAAREAATSTSWADPDEAFETALHAVVDRIYDDPDLHADVAAFAARDHAGRLVQLARPEARAAHDARRAGRLPGHRAVGQLAGRPGQPAAGRLRRAARRCWPGSTRLAAAGRRQRRGEAARRLAARCACAGDRPELFTGYRPVRADGPAAEHVVAFDRGGVIAVATRLPVRIVAASAAGGTPTLSLPQHGDASRVYRFVHRTRSTVAAGCRCRRSARPLPGRPADSTPDATGGSVTVFSRVGARRCPGTPARSAVRPRHGGRGRGGWWTARRPDGRPGHRLRVPARRRRPGRCPTRARPGSRTGCTAPAGSTTTRRSPGPTGAWTGRQLPGSVLYELHVGTFTPGGTFDAAIERLDHLVDLGVDLVELLPVNAFNGEHNWGYDGVCWFAPHEAYGGPDGLKRFVDACHRRGLGVVLDVVYNHLGPSGAYAPMFGRTSERGGQQPWGALGQPRRPAVRRGAPLHHRQRPHVAARLPRRRAAAGRRARAGRPQRDPPARGAGGRGRGAVGPPRPAAVADRRVRPQRPAADHRRARPAATACTAQWDDDVHHALHALLTGERQGYYADFGSLRLPGRRAHRRVLPRRHLVVASAAGCTAGRSTGTRTPGAPLRRLPAEPRPDRQPGARRPALRDAVAGPAAGRRDAAAHRAVHADAVHGRGVGRQPRRGSSSPATRSRSWPRRCDRPARGEFAAHGWRRDDVPDPQDPADLRCARGSTGPSSTSRSTPRSSSSTAR